jgi:hypothetical protein
MTDELEQLREDERLCDLLGHYADAGASDRAVWLDRVTGLGETGPAELTRLHGRLLAAAWIEQNTGHAVASEAGRVRQCYRVTAAGRQALRRRTEPDVD